MALAAAGSGRPRGPRAAGCVEERPLAAGESGAEVHSCSGGEGGGGAEGVRSGDVAFFHRDVAGCRRRPRGRGVSSPRPLRGSRADRDVSRGDRGGDGLPFPVRRETPPISRRLQCFQRTAGPRLLRSSCFGGPSRQLRGHSQGRCSLEALAPPRTAIPQGRRHGRARQLGGHDVRVPDAAAPASSRPRLLARRGERARRGRAAAVRRDARHAMGHVGVRIQRSGPQRGVSVQGLRSSGTRAQPRRGGSSRRRALRVCAGSRDRCSGRAREPGRARGARRARLVRLL